MGRSTMGDKIRRHTLKTWILDKSEGGSFKLRQLHGLVVLLQTSGRNKRLLSRDWTQTAYEARYMFTEQFPNNDTGHKDSKVTS
jgi:hypothetical protein